MDRKPAPEWELSVAAYEAMLRVSRQMRKGLSDLFAEHGLTGSQFAVMRTIPNEGITLTGLAKHVWKDPSNITGIVDRLEREGLVRRAPDPNDRRANLVFLTDEGNAVRAVIESVHPRRVHERMRALSQEEKLQFIGLLEKLHREERRGEES